MMRYNLFAAAQPQTEAAGAGDWQALVSSPFFWALVDLAVIVVLWNVIGRVMKRYQRLGNGNPLFSFIGNVLKALVVVVGLIRIFNQFGLFSGAASQIFMSSSLLIAVVGFVFQEGLSNIVHGFIISIFHPFNIGDRVNVEVDGKMIMGYVDSINLRHTILVSIDDSSHVIVPNSKMDTSLIANTYFDESTSSSNYVFLSVTYESDLEKAIALFTEVIDSHEKVAAEKKRQEKTESSPVIVLELADSGILLRGTVISRTVEENILVCSDIRRELVRRFNESPDLDMAYPHVHVVGLDRKEAFDEDNGK